MDVSKGEIMIFFMREIKYIIKDWSILAKWLIGIYLTSMIGMFFFELDTFWISNFLRTVWNFTWWFVVTISTVGYGDVSPKTVPGQFIGICDIVFGVGLMTVAIGKGVNGFLSRREKKMKGEGSYENYRDHIVILGGGKLEKLKSIVTEIRLDGINKETKILLVSDAYDKSPLEGVTYVKGKISCQDSLRRAGITNAENVIVYGYSDDETIMTTISVNGICSGNIVVYIRNRENYTYIDHLNESRNHRSLTDISIVGRCMDMLLAQEIADHGVVEVHNQLIANGGSTYYTIKYEGPYRLVIAVSMIIKKVCNGILIAVRDHKTGHVELNPGDEYKVRHGNTIYLIADKRPMIDWRLKEI